MYDLTVIGGGPGGYVAAIRAAQMGANTALVEEERLGGTCLNVGCIPSKVLLEAARRHEELRDAGAFGLELTHPVSVDLAAIMDRASRVSAGLVQGIESLLLGNRVKLHRGRGQIEKPGQVTVIHSDGSSEVIVTKQILLATGSKVALPPIPGIDLPGVLTSDNIWRLKHLPARTVVIGGGNIGIEFASAFAALGSQVTVVEMLAGIVPNADQEMARRLQQLLRRRGVEIVTGAKVLAIEPGSAVRYQNQDREIVAEADAVVISTGRKPNFVPSDMDRLGVQYTRTGLRVNDRWETTCPGIYAIGDVAGGGLAHVASAQGIACVEGIFGGTPQFDAAGVPAVVFSNPPLAWVGLTEQECTAQGLAYTKQNFPYSALGKAHVLQATEGTVKLLAEPESGRLLGMHILGHGAPELIHEGALALHMEATVADLAHTVHAHPTLAEGILEAAHGFAGGPIHLLRRMGAL